MILLQHNYTEEEADYHLCENGGKSVNLNFLLKQQ